MGKRRHGARQHVLIRTEISDIASPLEAGHGYVAFLRAIKGVQDG